MYILLIFYVIFIIGFMVFNTYVLFRVNTMRIKGDLTNRGMFVYAIAIAAILLISFMIIGSLDWSTKIIGGK